MAIVDDEIKSLLQFAERDVADQHEMEWAVRHFGPPGESFDETVCIMAIPAEDDPVHGIGPEDKHATLLYFGKMSESADPDRIKGSQGIFKEVLRVAAEEVGPFTAKVKSIDSLGDEGAQVWLLDSPDLQRLFEEIPEIDSEIHSMYEDAEATRYPEYLPHVTIGYPPKEEDKPENYDPDAVVTDETMDAARHVKEIAFDRISLWWGNEHIDFPLGVSEFDALLTHFEFDPTQPRATDGRWDPAGGGGGRPQAEKVKPKPEPAKEEPTMSKAQRKTALVKGILDALDSVLNDLTSDQARALIKKIKANANAFIEGQTRSTPGGGGGGGSKKGDGSGTEPATEKPKKDKGDGSGTEPAGGGGGDPAGTIEMIVNTVKSLLKGFGQNMKPKDRERLENAVDDLTG